jgi:hypothetical protein
MQQMVGPKPLNRNTCILNRICTGRILLDLVVFPLPNNLEPYTVTWAHAKTKHSDIQMRKADLEKYNFRWYQNETATIVSNCDPCPSNMQNRRKMGINPYHNMYYSTLLYKVDPAAVGTHSSVSSKIPTQNLQDHQNSIQKQL